MATYGGGMIIHSSGVFNVFSSGGGVNVLSVPFDMYAEVTFFQISFTVSNTSLFQIGGVTVGADFFLNLRSIIVPGGSSFVAIGGSGSVVVRGSYVIFKNSGA